MQQKNRSINQMLKAVKIRIYPNKTQQRKIDSLMGSCRFVYNHALSFKIDAYKFIKESTSIKQTSELFHGHLRPHFTFLKEHNTKVIKQSLRDLEQAYANFFKNKKGFPKFKSKHDEQRCRFPIDAISKDTFKKDKLNLTTTINSLKFKCSDRDRGYLLKNKERIKNVTLSKTKSGKYFASILIDGDIQRERPTPTKQSIGMDLGIKHLATFSNGEKVENPKWMRSEEKTLKKLQRQLSKKKKGSKNRNKAKIKLALKYEKIRNRKQTFLHELSSKLVNENQIISMEDLNVSGMMKNHKVAKAIQELGLFELKRQLQYKSGWNGRFLILVDRFFPSSKLCSCCDWKNENLTLADRMFACIMCGLYIDRDENAAINIEKEGMRIYEEMQMQMKMKIGHRLPEFETNTLSHTLVDNSMMDDPAVPLARCAKKSRLVETRNQ